MVLIKKLGFFGAPLLIMAAGAMAASGCDQGALTEACGPCGDVEKGDIGISGDAKLDGFFAAVATLNKSVVTVNGDFEANLTELEKAFGVTVDADASLSTRVDGVVAAIQAEVSANAEGSLTVDVQPAKCTANVNVAVEAQANCEAKVECDVKADPGKVDVQCEGTCEASCSGSCDGTVTCKVEAPSVACEGKCEGSCNVEVSAACEGTCKGSCDGECSAYVKNAQGEMECNGSCSGTCEGTCSASVSGSCEGTCSGSCTADPGGAECEGEVKCEGKCEGSCSGGCTGEATPPSASADCEASADCQAQAKAQASASMECTPPSVKIDFAFAVGASAEASASFEAKMVALRTNGVAMLAAFTKYSALINGEVNGQVVMDPAPLASVSAELGKVAKAGADGKLFADVPAGKIPCAIDGLAAAGEMLTDLGSEATANIEAQAKFVAAFTGGFSS
jgi:modification target Cys-rich repeat protein